MAGQQAARGVEGPEKRPVSNYNYDQAVLKVQEWNEALKCKYLVRIRGIMPHQMHSTIKAC